MTQAILNTRSVNKVQSNSNFHETSFVERTQAVRLGLREARPAMLEDYSRRSKTRMAHKIWKQSIPIIGSNASYRTL